MIKHHIKKQYYLTLCIIIDAMLDIWLFIWFRPFKTVWLQRFFFAISSILWNIHNDVTSKYNDCFVKIEEG